MGRAIKEENKIRTKRGQGSGETYITWQKNRELSSYGTASSVPDYKNGRMIELASQSEVWWYYKFRWNDHVEDIREHYPLDKKETSEIASMFGIREFGSGRWYMTTDFLITLVDGSSIAINVKYDRYAVVTDREREKFLIESEYWKRRGIKLLIAYKSDLDPIEIRNLRMVLVYYSKSSVFDKYSLAKYLIANKLIEVDMKQPINYMRLISNLEGEDIWKKHQYLLA